MGMPREDTRELARLARMVQSWKRLSPEGKRWLRDRFMGREFREFPGGVLESADRKVGP